MVKDLDLYDLRDTLMALDPDARDNLRALLDREEQRAPLRVSDEEDALWAGIVRHVPNASRHFKSLGEFLRDKRHGCPRVDFQDAVRTVFDLVHGVKAVRHPAQDAAALIDLMLDCLGTDMRRRNIAATPKTLVAEMPRLRLALDDAFPGYASSGMLHRLIKTVAVA